MLAIASQLVAGAHAADRDGTNEVRTSERKTVRVAFAEDSYWNTPLPPDAPVDPDSDEIVAFIAADSSSGYVRLAGTSSTGAWGNPIYRANRHDPAYAVHNTCGYRQPPEFAGLHIPAGARPDPTSDAAMTVYDRPQRIVAALWRASWDAESGRWSACGGAVYYLDSNGLAGELPSSDEPRNRGHRGVPPSTYAVRFAEIEAGSIDHVLKIAVDTTKCEHVFPMVGDECGTTARYAPPEGARIRIAADVDLDALGLSPPALVVARALQRYGAVIGDQSGGPVALKVENTIAEGKGWRWNGVLTHDSLRAIPWSAFEIVELGYRP